MKTETRPRVAITGVSGDAAQGIIKGLRESSLDPYLIGLDYLADNAGFVMCDAGVHMPSIYADDYIDRLQSACEAQGATILMSGIDAEQTIIAPYAERFAKAGITMVISTPDLVDAFSDKLETSRWLETHGLVAPKTFDAETTTLEEIEAALDYPVVFKPRAGHGSIGVHIVDDLDALAGLLNGAENAVVQEYAAGVEYTVATLFDRDGLCDSLIMRRELVGGRTLRSEVVDNELISRFVEAFGEKAGAFGPMNLQLRVDDDRVLVFEINPRFSGSTAMRVAAGYNEPARVLEYLVSGSPILPQPVAAGTRVYRAWSELVVPPEAS